MKLGQLFFRPIEDSTGKVRTEFVGTVIGVDVRKPDGSVEHFSTHPDIALTPHPISWRDLDQLKRGQSVQVNGAPKIVEKVFPIDGSVWLKDPVTDAVSDHKYFEIRVLK